MANKRNDRKEQRRIEALFRLANAGEYPCGHKHVVGNQHFCPIYTYNVKGGGAL